MHKHSFCIRPSEFNQMCPQSYTFFSVVLHIKRHSLHNAIYIYNTLYNFKGTIWTYVYSMCYMKAQSSVFWKTIRNTSFFFFFWMRRFTNPISSSIYCFVTCYFGFVRLLHYRYISNSTSLQLYDISEQKFYF